MSSTRLRSLCVFIFCSVYALKAYANGRPPNTTAVLANPYDANRLVIEATMGLFWTVDAGKTYHWICEPAVVDEPTGFSGTDPVGFWAGPQSLVLGTLFGVFRTDDDGCTWRLLPGFGKNVVQGGMSINTNNPNDFWATFTDSETRLTLPHHTLDGGNTLQPLSESFANLNVNWQDVKVHPSDANIVVVAGWYNNSFKGPLVGMSRDAGKTFSIITATAGPELIGNLVLALSPVNPNFMLIAMNDFEKNNGQVMALNWPDTAGKVVLQTQENLRHVLFEPNSNRAWIATQRSVFLSQDGAGTFQALPQPKFNACLGLGNQGIYACGASISDGFGLALWDANRQDWRKLFKLNLASPPPPRCAANTAVTQQCPALWEATATSINANITGSIIDPNMLNDASTTTSNSSNPGGGCRCSSSATDTRAALLPLLSIAALLAYRAARRQRSV
jgi:MYXO-CTERM domain-containing protein